jgi:hypothetical protein
MEAQSKVFVSGYGYITKEEANKVKLYKYFMYNSANICNCSDCPENTGGRGNLPCCQQTCWVSIHCN